MTGSANRARSRRTSLRCSPQGANTRPAATTKSTSLIRPETRTPVRSSELRLKPMRVTSRCPIRVVGARPAPIASSARTIDMNNKAGHRANPEKLFNEETAKGRVTDQNRDTDGESHHPGSQSKNVEPTPLPGNLRAEYSRRSDRPGPRASGRVSKARRCRYRAFAGGRAPPLPPDFRVAKNHPVLGQAGRGALASRRGVRRSSAPLTAAGTGSIC